MNDSEKILQQQIKSLKFVLIILVIALIGLTFLVFNTRVNLNSHDELTLQRLNIVNPDGKLTMVISNSELQHPGSMDGVDFEPRLRKQGIIFFNSDGDEVGGLIYDNRGLVFSVDKYKRDQIMQLQYMQSEDDARATYGLRFWDREGRLTLPQLISAIDSLRSLNYDDEHLSAELNELNGEPINATRMFVGRQANKEYGLFLFDKDGNPRIQMYLDANDNPKFDFLDKDGNTLPIDKR